LTFKCPKWFDDGQFFASNAPHSLQDTLLTYFKNNPAAYQEAVRQRPNGPLAISYVRGSRRNPVPDRFDCIFATPDFEVLQCSYDYEGAIGARSDHGFVLGGLILDEPSSKIHSNR
jgi:hypothetical protein